MKFRPQIFQSTEENDSPHSQEDRFRPPKVHDIPFYPGYQYERTNDGVSVWWFERRFSQISYGVHSKSGTNSCTLITVIGAEMLAKATIDTKARHNHLPNDLVEIYGKAILAGNKTYSELKNSDLLEDANLNIPEAMGAVSDYLDHIQEWFYIHLKIRHPEDYLNYTVRKMHAVIKEGVDLWMRNKRFRRDYLFVIVIADNRSILLCLQSEKQVVTLFDSHQHTRHHGACVAQSSWNKLESFVKWIVLMSMEIYNSKPTIFEISFIPIKGTG